MDTYYEPLAGPTTSIVISEDGVTPLTQDVEPGPMVLPTRVAAVRDDEEEDVTD